MTAGESSEGLGGVQGTQNTQYDSIGVKYNFMHELPAMQPERPSVVEALGDVRGKRCLDLACGTGRYTALLSSLGASTVHGYDISSVMIDGAVVAHPASTNPALHFSVADCSRPENLPPSDPFDIIFAGWFLNYAGTEAELTSMFRVIWQNLTPDGKFVGITTNVHDPWMKEPKHDFYGLEVLVLEREYVAPDTAKEVGIKARVVAQTDPVIQFDVFQFRKEVYERCAEAAGLRLKWRDAVVPDDERKNSGYWKRWLERPTFVIVEAVRQ